MASIDKAPDDTKGAQVATLLGSLVQRGLLNAVPFMKESYLAGLSDTRKSQLLGALTQTGISYSDGSPNRQLAGYLLANEDNFDSPQALNFIRRLLANYNAANNPDANMQHFLALASNPAANV